MAFCRYYNGNPSNVAVILFDLDGTLTDTAHDKFKEFKDGQSDFDAASIPILPGAIEFVQRMKSAGHLPLIVSDSHPKYVAKIQDLFQIKALSLADKPNTSRAKAFLDQQLKSRTGVDIYVVGDTWLDIELGRALNFPTILTNFYKPTSQDPRDGIGQDWKHLKSGPTYFAETFSDIDDIIKNPIGHLLAIEASFHNGSSAKAVRFKTQRNADRLIAWRSLGRQSAGECDIYGAAKHYFEFQREDRTLESLKKIAMAVEGYLEVAVNTMPWHFFTYVSDKATTIPPNKMQQLFDMIDIGVEKKKLIEWKTTIVGSIKHQKTYAGRRDFVNENIYLNDPGLVGKNIIIVDDQFTTGGTAYAICQKFIEKGARNILFVSLFYLITTVENEQTCPRCGTKLQVKVNRSKGNRFLSCVAPRFGGKGCGDFIKNIE